MKKVKASANILVDSGGSDWRKNIHAVAELLEKAANYSTRIKYHTLALSKEQEQMDKSQAELRVVSKQLALNYPDLDMYFIEAKGGFSFNSTPRRYDVLHATVLGGELSLQLIAEVGKEEDEDDLGY